MWSHLYAQFQDLINVPRMVKIIGNVSDWLSNAGGALIKVADSAGSTVQRFLQL